MQTCKLTSKKCHNATYSADVDESFNVFFPILQETFVHNINHIRQCLWEAYVCNSSRMSPLAVKCKLSHMCTVFCQLQKLFFVTVSPYRVLNPLFSVRTYTVCTRICPFLVPCHLFVTKNTASRLSDHRVNFCFTKHSSIYHEKCWHFICLLARNCCTEWCSNPPTQSE